MSSTWKKYNAVKHNSEIYLSRFNTNISGQQNMDIFDVIFSQPKTIWGIFFYYKLLLTVKHLQHNTMSWTDKEWELITEWLSALKAFWTAFIKCLQEKVWHRLCFAQQSVEKNCAWVVQSHCQSACTTETVESSLERFLLGCKQTN